MFRLLERIDHGIGNFYIGYTPRSLTEPWTGYIGSLSSSAFIVCRRLSPFFFAHRQENKYVHIPEVGMKRVFNSD